MCFKVTFQRAQGGSVTERQIVPGRGTKNVERMRASSRKFGSWDSEAESNILIACWKFFKGYVVMEIQPTTEEHI